ncbi:hypothetical protein PLICRDRAFT_33540 [Plicaturopsis crispa FD-325 SS-3]|nr:hypothetical protein PLICRDRAFT_33540 [Plicaturopsis crispa FD-325 SS-3]
MADSRFTKFSRVHYAPDDDETKEIRQIALGLAGDLVPANANVERLQAELRYHTEVRDNLQKSMELHNSLLSPVRRLHPDIWSEIFVHCLPDYKFPRPSCDTAPLLLGRVCKLWRDIATSTPLLWCSLMLPKHHDKTWEGHLQAIEETDAWLSRSGNLPLSLGFVDIECCDCMSEMVKYAARWKHLHVDLELRMRRWVFSPHRSGPVHMPLLESLTICEGDTNSGSSLPKLDAPRLRTFTASRYSYRAPSEKPAAIFPSQQLTHVTIIHSEMYMKDFRKLVTSCPELHVFYLRVFDLLGWRSASVPPLPPVVLPHLHTLGIQACYCTCDASPLLDELTLPSLRHAQFRNVFSADALLSLVSRSACRLESLHAVSSLSGRPGLFTLVTEIPTLSTLWVKDEDGGERITKDVRKLLEARPGSTGIPKASPDLDISMNTFKFPSYSTLGALLE